MKRRNAAGFVVIRMLGVAWMTAWALITTLIALLGPWMTGWPLAARTLALSGVMVPLSTLVVMPYLTERLGEWLRGEANGRLVADAFDRRAIDGDAAGARRDFLLSGGTGSSRA